jgi:HEAT repeat protein
MKQQMRLWNTQAMQMVQAAANQPVVFQTWVEQLASRDPHIYVPAIVALQQAGAEVIPTLINGLQHSNARVRRNCVDIIDHGGYGGDTRCVAALLPMLHDPVPHIRRAVWHTLFCERCQDETKCEVTNPIELDRVALLIDIGIHDPNPKLRQQLVANLGNYTSDPRARQALEHIAQA